MPNIKEVGIGGIGVRGERLRALRPDTVKELMESMRVNGLLQPIVLRPKPRTAGYLLVAGWHRLEAAKKLKWDSIRATIFDGMDADHVEMAEIDENLVRADLSPAERAAHHAARKEIYGRLHPETKKGATGRKGRTNKSKVRTYIDDASDKIKKSRSKVAQEVTRGTDIPKVASLAGTSLDKGNELDALAKLPPERRDALIDRAKAGEKVSARTVWKQISRALREAELAGKQAALPDRRYGVIVADPEWRFEPWSRDTGMDRAADNHYPTSVLEMIKARDVPSIAADDCVLFLWATNPMLPHALVVMAAWGFDYMSNYCWGKDKAGTGYWNRERHELLLIGTRGNVPCPAPGTQWDSLVMAPRGEHSVKPECFLEMIEQYFPNISKIELNRRGTPRPGWDAWGNEVAAEVAA